MDLLAIFFIVFILFLGLLFGLSYMIFTWIRNKGYDKRLRLLALIPTLIVGCFIYKAIYPSSNFFEKDFTSVTNMAFPDSGKIKYKTASFPDHFGDYTSSFLVELDQSSLKKLEDQLKVENFEETENKMLSNEREYIEARMGSRKYSRQYVLESKFDRYYSVGFLDDNKSVIVTRVSW